MPHATWCLRGWVHHTTLAIVASLAMGGSPREVAAQPSEVRRLPDSVGGQITTPNCGPARDGNNTAALTACSAAVQAAGGGVVRIPGGFAGTWAYIPAHPSVVWEFDGPNINRSQVGLTGQATDSGKVFAGLLGRERPAGNNRSGVSDFFISQGSGANGAMHGDFSHSILLQKQNWQCSTVRYNAGLCPTPAKQGELDALFIETFQGGPDATASPDLKSAGAAIVGGATCVGGVGFCAQAEMQTQILDPLTLAPTQLIDVQYGAIDTRPGEIGANGVALLSMLGTQSSAISVYANTAPASRWTNVLTNNYGGTTNFVISDNGTLRFSGGLLNLNNIPKWRAGSTYGNGVVVQTASGSVYRSVGAAGKASAEPSHTAGTVTGRDGISWLWQSTGATKIVDVSGGRFTITEPFALRSSDPEPIDIPIFVSAALPNGHIVAPPGALAIRPATGQTRKTLYVKEKGWGDTGWSAVLTATMDNTPGAHGTDQATATILTDRVNIVRNVPAGAGVVLQPEAGDEQIVVNAGPRALLLYPPSSARLNAHATDTAISVAAGSEARCLFGGSAQYYCSVEMLP